METTETTTVTAKFQVKGKDSESYVATEERKTRKLLRNRKDGSAGESTNSSFRGPEFRSQPHVGRLTTTRNASTGAQLLCT